MSLIIPANTLASGGYAVDNSVRLNDGSSDYFNRSPSSATNQKTFTISMWVKRSELGAGNGLLLQGVNSGNNDFSIYFNGAIDNLAIFSWSGSSEQFTLATNRKFRDVSAWYHIVVAVDTTQGTAANRVKLFINGVQETSFSTANYPSVNADLEYNDTSVLWVGRGYGGTTFDGYMAEVVSVDGSALAPTSFGEFDEDSGIFKPIDVSGLTFGTNGFYLDFENSGALGADVSGNSNNFTVNNLTAIDQSTDTCTNNFATLNPLNVPTSNAPTFAEGNLETESATTSGQRFMGSSTIGVTTGKWYAECKILVVDSCTVGISPDVAERARGNTYIGTSTYEYSILIETGTKYTNGNGTTYGAATSANGTVMIALDLDNNKVYFGSGGQWSNGSGAWNQSGLTSGAALSLTASTSTPEGAYFFACSDGGGSAKAKVQWNFGSPPYTISSGNTDGNGYGNFEYAVPSGYLSLCTANLSEVLG